MLQQQLCKDLCREASIATAIRSSAAACVLNVVYHRQHRQHMQVIFKGCSILLAQLLLLPLPLLLPFYDVRFVPAQPQHFDDRVGPLGLCAAVVTALFAILIVSFIDFLEFIQLRQA